MKNADFGVTRCNPRRHTCSKAANGRMRYPFNSMIIGDFFVVHSRERAKKINSALWTYRKSRGAGKKFTVTKCSDGHYICRRVK